MSGPSTSSDLDSCAQEPIRIPGGIQPHGAMIVVCDRAFHIRQVSENLPSILDLPLLPPLGVSIADVEWNCPTLAPDVIAWAADGSLHYFKTHEMARQWVNVSGYRGAQGLILEFERADARESLFTPYPLIHAFLEETEKLESVPELAAAAAKRVRLLTGFNRVLIYRFDDDWNGTVMAEDSDGTLPSYLDLRFPSSDIPAQARDLYRLNRLRLIASADYTPVALHPALSPADGAPLDMSFAALRSVSPVHLEYMRNMGTAASMSISLVAGEKLWGLISCHHAEGRRVAAPIRAACDMLGRIVAQQIDARERRLEMAERLRLHHIETALVAHLARAPSYQTALQDREEAWLGLVNADGAAVVADGTILTAGATPSHAAISALVEWLSAKEIEQVYSTDSLARDWDAAEEIADVASGLLAIPISRIHPSFILWFRPEVVRTVTWGGDPRTAKVSDAEGRIHPRRSFETWKEQVRCRSTPWREAEIASASHFRVAVIDFVLRRAEERAQLTEDLQRSNRELEAFSYSISHDLRAPFRHIAGYAQLLAEEEPDLKPLSCHYLNGISRAALSAGQLVDDLLHFSQLGRASLRMSPIDMAKVLDEVRHSLALEDGEREIRWSIGAMPSCWGDASLVRQALFNLVQNAVKYTRDRRPALIEVSGKIQGDEIVYTVSDNGVGFDMAYAGKLFQVFQRLHRAEDYEGTGIGLALTKRIIERHGGSVHASGAEGQGATFSFSLPRSEKGKGRGDA